MRRLNKDIERGAFSDAKKSGRVGKDRDQEANWNQRLGKMENRTAAGPGAKYNKTNGS